MGSYLVPKEHIIIPYSPRGQNRNILNLNLKRQS